MGWREDFSAQYSASAIKLRALGCFEAANDAEEASRAVLIDQRSRNRTSEYPLHERVELSKKSPTIWDDLSDEGVPMPHARPFGPSRNGSTRCQSGSIASGGPNSYCSCDRCF